METKYLALFGPLHKLTPFGSLLATEGVAWLAEHAKCYWLIDEISLAQRRIKALRNHGMQDLQVWTLKVANIRGTVTLGDGSGNTIFQMHVPLTDFPLTEITLWG